MTTPGSSDHRTIPVIDEHVPGRDKAMSAISRSR